MDRLARFLIICIAIACGVAAAALVVITAAAVVAGRGAVTVVARTAGMLGVAALAVAGDGDPVNFARLGVIAAVVSLTDSMVC